MSVVGNCVMFGGGGGSWLLPSSCAVLRVTALTGSDISITNGAQTKVSRANKGKIRADQQYASDYYFSIQPTAFGEWEITSDRNGEIGTTSIIVDSVKQFEKEVYYHVPLDYQEVEYIEATGTQYIALTSDVLASGYSATIKYRATTFTTKNPVLHHGTTNSNARRGNLGTLSVGYSGWYNNQEVQFVTGSLDLVTCTVSNTGSGIDLVLVAENARNPFTHTWSYTPNLTGGSFICRNGYSTYQYGKHRVYYYEFKNGDTLLRQMYPCYRRSDNVAGMYDKITGTFFTNSGTGTFVVGGDVS